MTVQYAPLLHFQENLLQEFARNIRFLRNVRDHHRLIILAVAEDEEGAKSVTGFLG